MLSAYRESVVVRNLKCSFCCFSLNQIKTWPHRKLFYTSSAAVVLCGSKCHSFVEIHADKVKMHIFCSKSNQQFSWICLQPSTSFIQFFLCQHVFCMLSLCTELNLLLTTSSCFFKIVLLFGMFMLRNICLYLQHLLQHWYLVQILSRDVKLQRYSHGNCRLTLQLQTH